jgi:hypothetical protein
VCTTRCLMMVLPWGLDGVSAIAEGDGRVALCHHTGVALKRMMSNGLKNRPWWEKNAKSSVYQHSKLAIATKGILGKSFHRSWVTYLLDSEDLEGMSTDHGQISDGWLLDIDFSRTLTAQENSTSTTYLTEKELMLRGHRDWRQGTKSTRIIKTDFYKGKEG